MSKDDDTPNITEASAFCTFRVRGGTYAELEQKARNYAARFFAADPDDLIVVDPPTARVVSTAHFSVDLTRPEEWEASFTIALHRKDHDAR